MFDTLSDKMESVFRGLTGKGKLTATDIKTAMVEVKRALIEADVNLDVANAFVDTVEQEAVGEAILTSLTPGQQVVEIVYNKLVEMLGGESTGLTLAPTAPTIILMAGLQGSGKTTTVAKLALELRKNKQKPLLVAADIYRPAAINQLESLGRQLNIPVFSEGTQVRPPEIAQHAIAKAKAEGNTVVIIDTAGRLQIDEPLMQELVEIKSRVNPTEILLVVDAMTGQESVNVAREFNRRAGITGVIMTKMDGDARGGAAMSVRAVTGVPIKFIGVGEKANALEPFYPDRIASRILGMGDVLTLVEKARAIYDEEQARKLQEKMKKGKFDLEDFLNQMRGLRKMGPLGSLLGLLPGMGKQMKELRNALETPEAELMLKRTEAIILSMTQQERSNPDVIDASRRRRIAKGSGTSVADVNDLLQQFKMMRQMTRNMTNGKGMDMASMMSGMGPGMPGGVNSRKQVAPRPVDPLADFKKGARPGGAPANGNGAKHPVGSGTNRPPMKKKKK
jgi:signal recognition particle subunit SRP54